MKIAKVRSFVLLALLLVALGVIAYLWHQLRTQHPHKMETAETGGLSKQARQVSLPTPKTPKSVATPQPSSPPAALAPDFIYPVIEKRVSIEFLGSTPSRKLLIRNLDAYKLFCLNEILREAHVDFALDKHAHMTTIIVYLPRTSPKRFLEELSYYQIPYQFD